MGVPINVSVSFNNLFGRAYNLIYNDWFRDENLQNSLTVDKDDGPDDIADYVLKKRGKRHDYFTSALPWPQKGDAVTLPLGQQAPITGDFDFSGVATDAGNKINIVDSNGNVKAFRTAGNVDDAFAGSAPAGEWRYTVRRFVFSNICNN